MSARTLLAVLVPLVGLLGMQTLPSAARGGDGPTLSERLDNIERRLRKLESTVGTPITRLLELPLFRRVEDLESAVETLQRSTRRAGRSVAPDLDRVRRETESLQRTQRDLRDTLERMQRDLRNVRDVSERIRSLERELDRLRDALRSLERRVDRLERG